MKNILITGAAKGIGSEIAILFAKEGYNVIINYKTSEKEAKKLLEEITKKGGKAEIYKADVSSQKDVQKMIKYIEEKYKKIDVLVNNAGISRITPFLDISENEWDEVLNNNLKSAFLCSKEVLKNMIKYKEGNIINISSIWGIKGGSCEVHYSASKAGMIGLTKALANEMSLSNIRINAIAPGIIDTDMNNDFSLEEIKNIEKEIPLQRLGKKQEIANAVLFLVKNEYITGKVIEVDGGW